MKKQLLCSVAAIAITASLTGLAGAADLPRKAPPAPVVQPPPLLWNGFYVGGHLGWGRAKVSGFADHSGDIFPYEDKPQGLVGGLHGGYNWQVNTFVFGVEADLSAAGLQKTNFRINDGSQPCQSSALAACTHTNINMLGSLRARLGLSFDRALVYGTGGLGYARWSTLTSFGTTAFGAAGNKSTWGWVAGGGVEWKQTPNFSWRVEALYYGFNDTITFGNHDSPPTNFATAKLKDVLVVRLGATYHFDGGGWGR